MAAFLDTNILLYADDVSSGAKAEVAVSLIDALLMARMGVISTQVLQEYYTNAVKKLRLTKEDARNRARMYARMTVLPISADIVFSAMELHRVEQISFWDALILRTASAAGCATLYSEDLQPGRTYDGVRIVNPFA